VSGNGNQSNNSCAHPRAPAVKSGGNIDGASAFALFEKTFDAVPGIRSTQDALRLIERVYQQWVWFAPGLEEPMTVPGGKERFAPWLDKRTTPGAAGDQVTLLSLNKALREFALSFADRNMKLGPARGAEMHSHGPRIHQ
jgi:hypothetical protein